MARAGSEVTEAVLAIMRGASGLPYAVEAVASREGVALAAVEASQVVSQNIGHELAERTAGVAYPAFYVYCEKVSNQLREKFRTFSGTVRIAIDVRVSRDRLEGIGEELGLYVQAVTDALDTHRGDWGGGMFYSGGYEITFGPVKHGGRNFVQPAKVVFDVDVSLG